MGWLHQVAYMKGEKCVANFDEDAITMATEASLNCLYSDKTINPSTINGLYFATTTSPFKEKQVAVTIAAALDLPREIFTLDSTGSLRSGTNALRSALDAVRAGTAEEIMVTMADCRLAYSGSPLEQLFGDAGAALLISNNEVAVEVKGIFSLADEITDVWRKDGDRFVQAWEDRFTLTEGFQRVLKKSFQEAISRFSVKLPNMDKIIYYAPDARAHSNLAKSLGINYRTQVQNPLLDAVGNAGTASPFLQLMAALDEAKPGDQILMASYGNGIDIFLLKTTDLIKKVQNGNEVKKMIASKKVLPNYYSYLNLRNLIQTEPNRQPPIFPPATVLWREQESILRLHGSKCKRCGNVQYPIQRICSKCYSKDEFDTVRLSDQKARVYLSTTDPLSYGAESSPFWAIADMPIGVRVRMQITECDSIEEVPFDTELVPTFRKFQRHGEVPVYFWKLKLPR
jgi:3-hydroxy-3-methylglutaryl CoA synthase